MNVSSDPSISIIMPVYNAEAHLEEALNSALEQSLQGIELICIDDGSTDSSAEILKRYEDKDDRIRIVRQKNAGSGPARNAGLAAARGSYIAFLDSDDFYPGKTCLQELYELAVTNDAKIAGGSLLFFENDRLSKASIGGVDFTFDSSRTINYKDYQQAYYYQRFIYSREMLGNAGIVFPDYRRFQDVVFFVKAMTEAGEFVSMPSPVYVYRKSSNFAALNDEQINDMLRGYIDVLSVAKENHFPVLLSFLSNRIYGRSPIAEMVRDSINSGNRTADSLYSEALSICDIRRVSLRAGSFAGFLSIVKKIISGCLRK